MKSESQRNNRSTMSFKSELSQPLRTSSCVPLRSADLERSCHHAPRKQSSGMWRRYRAVFVLALLSGVVLADAACVRNVRAVNDNFYVINRKAPSSKPPAQADQLRAHANPQLSDS